MDEDDYLTIQKPYYDAVTEFVFSSSAVATRPAHEYHPSTEKTIGCWVGFFIGVYLIYRLYRWATKEE